MKTNCLFRMLLTAFWVVVTRSESLPPPLSPLSSSFGNLDWNVRVNEASRNCQLPETVTSEPQDLLERNNSCVPEKEEVTATPQEDDKDQAQRSWFEVLLSFLPQAVVNISVWSKQYYALLNEYPLLMKSCTAAVVALVGDIAAQAVIERRKVDGSRSITVAAESLFVSGPLLHFAYGWMDTYIQIDDSSVWLGSILQVLLDIFVMDSIFTGTLMVVSALLQGQSLSSVIQELRTEYKSAAMAAWLSSLSMSPLQFCNFQYIPVEFRVLITNFQDVIWNAVVSFMTHRKRRRSDMIVS